MLARYHSIYEWILKPKLFFVIILILFIFIFGTASRVIYYHYDLEIDNSIRSNRASSNLLANIIMEHQETFVRVIESYSNRPLLVNAVKNKNYGNALIHLIQLKINTPEIDEVFIADKKGNLWLNFPVDKEFHGKNLSHLDWYKGINKEWKSYISCVQKDFIDKKILQLSFVPLY